MNKNKLFFTLLILSALVTYACGIKKKIGDSVDDQSKKISAVEKNENKKAIITNVLKDISTTLPFNHFNVRAKGEFNMPNLAPLNVTLVIRTKNDAFWVSVQAVIGIEVFRVLMDKEYLQVLNRHENTYQKLVLKDFLNNPSTFNNLFRYALMGKLLESLKTTFINNGEISFENGIKLSTDFENIKVNISLNPDKSLRTFEIILNENKLHFEYIYYENFKIDTNEYKLPKNIILNLSVADKEAHFNMELTRINTKKSNFPFSIPNRYENK